MSATSDRNTVLVVGSTGSLGKPIVSELLRRGVSLRLMGRSHESLIKEGYINEAEDGGFSSKINADIVVCNDVTKADSFKDEWFQDVLCVICVARPRSLIDGDSTSYIRTINNICNAAKANYVPKVLLHGIPYVESNIISESSTMSVLREAEQSAKDALKGSPTTLTISRICEHSEILHLLEAVDMIGWFPCASGINPVMHPISARDFANAVADYAEDSTLITDELLVGGPDRITWRELGNIIAQKRDIHLVALPLAVYKLLLAFVSLASMLLPALNGLCLSMRLILIPMTTNTANDKFMYVGSDTIEAVLNANEIREENKGGWVHEKVFGSSQKKRVLISTWPSPVKLSNIIWVVALCDGLTAVKNPVFISKMMSINLQDIDGILVQSFGCVSFGIAMTTFSSLHSWSDEGTRKRSSNTIGLLFDLISLMLLLGLARLSRYDTVLCVLGTAALFALLLTWEWRLQYERLFPLAITAFGLGSYFVPSIILSALFGGDISDKSIQHFRQIAIWYIGSGVQKLALLHGVEPYKAAGIVSLVWSLFSIELWRIVNMPIVFEMSSFSKNVNATFPVWSGMLAVLILCRKARNA